MEDKTLKAYPKSIMENLRERMGLDENDTSADEEIMDRTPQQNFSELLEWHGLIGYASTITQWVDIIFGIDLDKVVIEEKEDITIFD
jgi:hypothetical protein